MKAWLVGLLLGYSLLAQATQNQVLVISVKRPTFDVVLPANPTTGFQWSVLNFDKNLLALSGTLYIKPKTNLIGAEGQMQFTFQLQQGKKFPQSTDIQFQYARAWEPKSATLKTVTVQFIQ